MLLTVTQCTAYEKIDTHKEEQCISFLKNIQERNKKKIKNAVNYKKSLNAKQF
jgi:hypothetical protein